MTAWLNSILEYIVSGANPYYFLPFIFASVVLYVQLKKGNTYLMSLIISVFEIFSITTSVEYILIFIFTGSLPKSIELLDKIILFIGTSITFLFMFRHTTESTRIGNQIDIILNKYFLPKPTPTSISPFMEQLEQLKSLRENMIIGNKDQVNNAYNVFLENGTSIMMSLVKNSHINNEDITQIRTLFDHCKEDFKNMCDYQIFDEKQKVKTAGSLSEFIGSVDGFTKQS